MYSAGQVFCWPCMLLVMYVHCKRSFTVMAARLSDSSTADGSKPPRYPPGYSYGYGYGYGYSKNTRYGYKMGMGTSDFFTTWRKRFSPPWTPLGGNPRN